jgi:hypothetical protein
MIRNLMLAVGLFTMTGTSAMAATTHARAHHKVAQGETTDAPKAKKGAKAHKGNKKAKAEGDAAKGEAPKAEAPKAEPAPAPAK